MERNFILLQISVTKAEVSGMDKQDELNIGIKLGSWGATLANRSNTVEDDRIRTSRVGETHFQVTHDLSGTKMMEETLQTQQRR